ncbi:hypothetical protein C8R43DRAFT_1041976 [Mycena crocata]|nr:hypothetical protein C8R43DRAFT_1041976 [Mycena crocata]
MKESLSLPDPIRKPTTPVHPLSSPPHSDNHDDGDDLASARLWAVYISEAEKYDKALVEGWKSDMEGLLIFAGLFSASLTAFIIESYRTLTPDQGAITIALLTQISRQLDSRVNASAAELVPLAAFSPTSSSLACNIFWFLSLGFSLCCALVATLVEQWSRDFIQKTEMRPSPVIRARIYSYLYFGLQRFGMHTTVACLPLLLHASLFLFFAGLVAFLQPINAALMTIAALLLVLFLTTYIYLTLLPIFASDSPYRTPLSNMAWSFFPRVIAPFAQHRTALLDPETSSVDRQSLLLRKNMPTMVDAMADDAIRKSAQRDARDDALPDLVWGPSGRRRVCDETIDMLLDTPDIQLVPRIEGLLRSCSSGLLHSDHATRRRISCMRAIWALSYFAASDAPSRQSFPIFNPLMLSSFYANGNGATSIVDSHAISAYTLVRWCGFCAVSKLVRDATSMLIVTGDTTSVPHFRASLKLVQDGAGHYGNPEFGAIVSTLGAHSDWLFLLQRSRQVLMRFDDYAYDILTEYLQNSAPLAHMPFEFEATYLLIQPSTRPNEMAQKKLKDAFINLLNMHADRLRSVPSEGLRRGLKGSTPEFIGGLITQSLAHEQHHFLNILATTWGFCLIPDSPLAVFDEATFNAISSAPRFPISSSAIIVLKSHILMHAIALDAEELESLMDRLEIPTVESRNTMDRFNEAQLVLLVDFLEEYNSLSHLNDWLKTRMLQTFDHLRHLCPPFIPPPLQGRFATWFLDVTNPTKAGSHILMIDHIISCWRWEPSRPLSLHLFYDASVRSTIREALTAYAEILSAENEHSLGMRRMVYTVISVLAASTPDGTSPVSEDTNTATDADGITEIPRPDDLGWSFEPPPEWNSLRRGTARLRTRENGTEGPWR